MKIREIDSCSESTVDADYQCYKVSVQSDIEAQALNLPSQLTVPYIITLLYKNWTSLSLLDGSFSEELMREMVLVLANLFGRRYLSEDFINQIKPKSSIVSTHRAFSESMNITLCCY